MERILQLVVILGALWWMTAMALPAAARALESLVSWLVHGVVQVAWTAPMRRLGVVATLWLWALAGAGLATVVVMINPRLDPAWLTTAVRLLKVWAAILVAWLVVRWWAIWLFRPRPLPRRRR